MTLTLISRLVLELFLLLFESLPDALNEFHQKIQVLIQSVLEQFEKVHKDG